MRIASLGSGSKGNATLISSGLTTVLIDCGYSLKKIQIKAHDLGFDLSKLNAILVTHEHSDHISGVAKLAAKYQIQVYLSQGTAKKLKDKLDDSLINYIHADQLIKIQNLAIQAVTVPHDCNEPLQFVFKCMESQKSLGVLTDIGHISPHVMKSYSGLDGLLLEFNYDQNMLNNGPYPYSLKQRVSSDYGHLSNDQSMQLLRSIDLRNMKTLIIGHISEKNNDPKIIKALFQSFDDLPEPLLATQQDGFPWVAIT